MSKVFSEYTNTVRQFLMNYNHELYEYFNDSNIEEVWIDHDNWNGGIDYYNIVILVPVAFFESLQKDNAVAETENKIHEYYVDAMRGDDGPNYVRGVFLRPLAKDFATIGENVDDTMWKPGHFRLFISHLSKNKISASNLKCCLAEYGIDCFVAHEDITPSKEWEVEIEKALFTMDALCAIVVPDFINSQCCDQEVGIALGLRKLVISIDKGSTPYGFFGKYQALKSKDKNANEIALAVWQAISINEKTKNTYQGKLVALIINATNETDAIRYIGIIKQCENIGKQYIENLHDNFISNDILNSLTVINSINPIFQKYGLMPLSPVTHNTITYYEENLPF